MHHANEVMCHVETSYPASECQKPTKEQDVAQTNQHTHTYIYTEQFACSENELNYPE